jgi:hypothetical protein
MVHFPLNAKRVYIVSVVRDSVVDICTKRGKSNGVVICADQSLELLGTLRENCFPIAIDVCF